MEFMILFKPKLGAWVIQVSNAWFLPWKTVQANGGDNFLTFKTYNEANNFVTTTGLEQAYLRKNYVSYTNENQTSAP